MKRVLAAVLVVFVVVAVAVIVVGMLFKPGAARRTPRARGRRLSGDGRSAGRGATEAAVSFAPGAMAPVPEAVEPATVPVEGRAAERTEGTAETGPGMLAPEPEEIAEAPPAVSGITEGETESAAAEATEAKPASTAVGVEEGTETPRWDEYPGASQNGTAPAVATFPPPVVPAGPPLEPGTELESDDASGAAQEAAGDQPETPVATSTLESEAVEPGDDVSLPESVEQALNEAPPSRVGAKRTAESYLDEGNVYFNVGQYRLAIERYTSAVELSDQLVAAFYNRANAHTRNGDYDKALADYDRALELEPADADALNNRGMLHLYRSNYEAALDDFDAALKLDPQDTTVMVNRGLAHLHGGNPASALVDFQEAASLDSDDAAAHYGAAQAAAELTNRESAIRHLRRALELDPGYAREAAGDPKLELLQGSDDFLRLLRESGSRTGRSASA